MKPMLIAAVIGATALSALPASARVIVHERAGVVVRYDHHHHGWHHGWGYHYGWRHRYRGYGYAECGFVRVRERLPNGTIIIKTRRTC